MGITLYTIGCPKCNILKKKLDAKNIKYDVIDDIEVIKTKGFDLLPILEIDGSIKDFAQANDWINNK